MIVEYLGYLAGSWALGWAAGRTVLLIKQFFEASV